MLFSEVLGLPHIKNHLTTTAEKGRVPHAQLFVGSSGSGTLPMAIAYAQYILCQNTGGENNSGIEACNIKMNKLSHPDLHFAFPVAANDKVKKNPVSGNFLDEWRQFVENEPYGSLFDWYQKLGIENKQGQIGVHEAQDIVKSLSLKAYEGGYKVMIIWMAEKMNTACANKLLKLIEEPPKDTLFLLITEEEENIIQTIRSRCQTLHFPPLNEAVIAEGLMKNEACEEQKALTIAHRANGNYSTALDILQNNSGTEQFEEWFITWVRSAFKAKGNKSAILDLISWSETIAATGRETQKKFLLFCQDFFRQALLQNYKTESLVFMQPQTKGFSLEKFAPFVSGNNILGINKELEDAIYHIERNGNAKIILTDLSIKLTRLLHSK
ncbi:DNA polymerase-3 subunit delta' [Salinimicrobium catena]|uniref:DNA polymerase-3 subunit delta n=1 Tax=Salinimicrobium catena TaxID=390640 RepID=A0A1H5IHU8_9FLAO|nr:DNA polymerase III subunit delta' [Salinimicrobium catena]SDK77893.1 DNA polymerase-3 subunit delta' [Salinimicrobium catena]SEE39786.1 DNA polymerase-3 subunit delta' [Salinimicrobium catena]